MNIADDDDAEQPPRVPARRCSSSDLRVSGTPRIDLRAALDKPQSNLIGDARRLRPEHADHAHGRRHLDAGQRAERLLGLVVARASDPDGTVIDFDACYQQPIKPTVTVTATQGWRISRGILDSSNRDSLYADVPDRSPGAEYEFKFPILPVDYTIPAGHRVGIVLMANFSNARAQRHDRHDDHAELASSSKVYAAGRRRLPRAGRGRRAGGRTPTAPVFRRRPRTSTRRRATRPARPSRSRCRWRPTTRTRARSVTCDHASGRSSRSARRW